MFRQCSKVDHSNTKRKNYKNVLQRLIETGTISQEVEYRCPDNACNRQVLSS